MSDIYSDHPVDTSAVRQPNISVSPEHHLQNHVIEKPGIVYMTMGEIREKEKYQIDYRTPSPSEVPAHNPSGVFDIEVAPSRSSTASRACERSPIETP